MNSTAVDITDMLEGESSLELVHLTNLFVGREPTSPINTVTIIDSTSFPPMKTLKKGENYFYPGVQILIRNSSYMTGWALGRDIRTALHQRAHETWNGTYYSLVSCQNGPELLNWDEKGNARFVLNFNVQRR